MNAGWSRCRRWLVLAGVVLVFSGVVRESAAKPREAGEKRPAWGALWAWVEGVLAREWPWALEKEGSMIDPHGSPYDATSPAGLDEDGLSIGPHG